MLKVLRGVAAAALLLSVHPTLAADHYPDHIVKIVVPYPAGGVVDIVGRILADRLGDRLKQTFIVDNRPGAGSIIGSDVVAKSNPDGYTLLMGTVANTSLNSVMTHVPFDLNRDLVPLCYVLSLPNILVVQPSSPYHSVKDIVAAAKAHPGSLKFGSSGLGSTPHLSGELLKAMTGTNMVHVPYKSNPQGELDLMAGRIDFMFDNAALSQVRGGKLRAIGVSTIKRSSALPDVPTVDESGVPGFETASWHGLWARRGTPQPVIDLLDKNIKEVFQEKGVKEKMDSIGADINVFCGQKFQAKVDSEVAKWKKLVKDANIKIEN